MNTEHRTDYQPQFEGEFELLFSWIFNEIEKLQIPKNLLDSKCLGNCFVVTVIDVIRGALGALKSRSFTSCNAIFRVLLELSLDLKLIAIHDDKELNNKFANYYKIKLYRDRKRVTAFKNEIPRIEKEYQDYILHNFPEIFETLEQNSSKPLIHNWNQIDKLVWKRYGGHWSGLSFADRVAKIENQLRTGRIQSPYSTNKSDPLIGIIQYFWNTFSNHIHPTPFNVLPHFSPKLKTFEFKYNVSDEFFKDTEQRLFLIFDHCVEAFSMVAKPTLHGEFIKLIDKCPNLHSYIYKE